MPFVPGDVLDLGNWSLTLPVGDADRAAEVFQPDLDTFEGPYFSANAAGTAVVFVAPVGGSTTAGTDYPRSELREMFGARRAAWSTRVGVHTLTVTEAITHVPPVKPHVVAAQVHDGTDDVLMIRLEGTRLFVESGGDPLVDLDPAYTLGEVFTVRFVAADGWVSVYYQDLFVPAVRLRVEADACYFKVGAYTQSNVDRGDAPDAVGGVEILALEVTHEGGPSPSR